MLWRELCALFDDYFRICFPVVPCRETALKICPSFFFLSLFFLPFDLQSSFIVRLLKQQKGKADVWPSECHSCKKRSYSERTAKFQWSLVGVQFIACISESASLMLYLLPGLGWARKESRE